MSFPSLQEIAQRLGGEVSGGEVLAPGPGHSPVDRSMAFKIARDAPEGFVVHSFAGDDPLACRDHARELIGLPQPEFKRTDAPSASIINMQRRAAKAGPIVASYKYRAADGSRYIQATRHTPKDFRAWRWTGVDYVAGGVSKLAKVPYRLPELLSAVHDAVFVVEGEKDADRLAAAGFVATTNIFGAGKWTPDLNQYFVGKRVFILPDNDTAGAEHAQDVASNLHGIANDVRIVNLPGLPDKGDVSDWIDAGGDTGTLVELCESAPVWSDAQSAKSLIVSSREFVAGFIPPDYLIDGMLQKRYCYSITAPTGAGKTALLLLFSASVAKGWTIGESFVERGRVLYLAGENPDDVRMRWIAMGEALGFDVETIDVHFLPGTPKLSEIADRIRAKVEEIGPLDLVIVDTSAAYGEYDEENANKQMGDHARRMRALTTLPGGPCVLVACHPVKNAQADNLLPRGGGAFLAEVDGNLTLWKTDNVATLHWQGKFRGPEFAPVPFSLTGTTTERLRDSRGRLIPTVYAKAMTEKERGEAEAGSWGDEDALLVAILAGERSSFAELAIALGWTMKDGQPNKAKVHRTAKRLKSDKLVKQERGGTLSLTDKGKEEAERAKYNAAAAGGTYGT